MVRITCRAPSYEQGSSRLLSFAKKVDRTPDQDQDKAKVNAVWSIADVGDDEVDLVDEDDLLDEDDLAKPDPASLRGEGGSNFFFKKK